MDEDKAYWVLAVDKGALLLALEDGVLEWRPLEDCTLARAQTPDQPRLVMPVQPQQGPQITIPQIRANGRN